MKKPSDKDGFLYAIRQLCKQILEKMNDCMASREGGGKMDNVFDAARIVRSVI